MELLSQNTPMFFILILGVTFIFSIIINNILIKFAQTLGIRQRNQREIRWNTNVRPALGGISFYVIFLLTFISLFLINNNVPIIPTDFNSLKLFGILIVCSLAFMMGLADDAYNTQPLLKFITQIVCGLVLVFTGTYIHLFENVFFDYTLTILWVVGLMNSLNMLDNMDAITTVVSIVILIFVITINIYTKTIISPLSLISIGVLGALLGFLIFNWHPAKMFMGDTGSQFLGSFLAILGIEYCWNITNVNSQIINADVNPVLLGIICVFTVFILPITDTTTVTINRMFRGQSPFIGGKDHTTHHLFFKGITEKKIAIMFIAIGISGAYFSYQMIVNFSMTWLWLSIIFSAFTFVSLYLNTVIKSKK